MTISSVRKSVALLLLVSIAACGRDAAAPPQTPAVDAIYVNGKVVTVDGQFSTAQAFAVGGEKFVAVGDNASIRKLATAKTTVLDLGGRTVVPGFIDTHAHTFHRGRASMAKPSLVGLKSVAQIADRIAEAAAQAAPGEWIVSTAIGDPPDYYNLPEGLAEKRWPTRTDLDKVAPRNPVILPTVPSWPHPAVFNSAALALLGVSRATRDEPGIKIVKDASGEPTGVIYGLSMYNQVPLYKKLQSLLPPMPPDVQLEGVRRAMQGNIAVGITAIYEGHGANPAQFKRTAEALRAAGGPVSRVASTYEMPPGKSLAQIDEWMKSLTDAAGAGTGDDFFKSVGVTVSLDGSTQFGKSFMKEPYLNMYGVKDNGRSSLTVEELTDVARLAVKHNLRLNVMAAGSAANEIAVAALEAVNRETPIKDRRWVVQHFQHPTPELIAKLRDMNIAAQTYTSVDYSKGAEIYEKRFPGQDVWQSVVPMRWWIDGGVTVAQSTDGAHYHPMFTIWESLVRVDGRTGKSLLTPQKTITREEAIRIYTINGARLMQWEDRLGSIEAGKLADFVVVDRDILNVPTEQIREAQILLTAMGGKVLHDPQALAGAAKQAEAPSTQH